MISAEISVPLASCNGLGLKIWDYLKWDHYLSLGLTPETETEIASCNRQASTRSLTYDECMKVCMYEKLQRHSNPSSGIDGTAQTGDWLSKHTHICSCKHTLAHVWRVHEGMHVWKIENTHKSIIRARWNNTNWLLTQQTYTHLAHAWRVHESMHVWEIEKPQIHHQG